MYTSSIFRYVNSHYGVFTPHNPLSSPRIQHNESRKLIIKSPLEIPVKPDFTRPTVTNHDNPPFPLNEKTLSLSLGLYYFVAHIIEGAEIYLATCPSARAKKRSRFKQLARTHYLEIRYIRRNRGRPGRCTSLCTKHDGARRLLCVRARARAPVKRPKLQG